MRIPCPHCGTRGNEEFTILGAAGLQRPAPDVPAEAWHDYVHLRDNPAGPHRELWHHSTGCRSWLVVERDTRTHAVLSVIPAREQGA
ncbi:MAG TPA: sarcosine oxidase subunit delta [Acetobacteraceae bacterium]|nr:sarcosine oxidase subunit delta [Acetobacteraceae bacterium]